MKLGIILQTNDPEKAWNAFRFATTARKAGHEVRHDRYDVDTQWKGFLEAGGELLACDTCLKSRKLEESTECPVSTMLDCVNLVTWAERVVTF
jgi:uncharacterized protein involved in oxidation of intracellular sulfur